MTCLASREIYKPECVYNPITADQGQYQRVFYNVLALPLLLNPSSTVLSPLYTFCLGDCTNRDE